ncbi:MAG: Ig-like domain-containing protein [Gemmatimonadota bacterium]
MRDRYSFLTTPSALFLLSFILLSTSCVDGPAAPAGEGATAPFLLAPSLSLVGPTGAPAATEAQQDALNEAFDRVNRFRIQVRREDGSLALDTIVSVAPGQDEYDFTLPVQAVPNETFEVRMTAFEGDTVLFTAQPAKVKAVTPAAGGAGAQPTPTNITMRYAGPGRTAATVQVAPAYLVLGPGGQGTLTAEVQDSAGAVVADVPLAWTVAAGGVVTVNASGAVSAEGDGATEVIVATPTGLEGRAWVYVIGGELAYVEGGILKTRPAAGGPVAQQSASGAAQPSWSVDGSRLFYVLGGAVRETGVGGALLDGAWPSLSPDGTKLAVERAGRVYFANDDGSNVTEGPEGESPVWDGGADVLVAGGSIERVRADGRNRATVAEGAAELPARSASGRVAYVADGALRAEGVAAAMVTGAVGRPTWSADGRWLVVQTTEDGLVAVPADRGAPPVPLPGLKGGRDPAFRPSGALQAPPNLAVTALDPDPPVPGEEARILGSGFDWIIPANNRVTWPTQDGTVEGEIREVTATSLEVSVPRTAVAGQVRVETRRGQALLAFEPALSSLIVRAQTPDEQPVEGLQAVLLDADGTEVGRGATDAAGAVTFANLLPGSYLLDLTPPQDFFLEDDARRTVEIEGGIEEVEVEVVPDVAQVFVRPEALSLEVGSSLDVELIPVTSAGDTIRRPATVLWSASHSNFSVTFDGLAGTLRGVHPMDDPAEGPPPLLEVSVNGRPFEFPVVVTSYVTGTVTQDPDPATSPDRVSPAPVSDVSFDLPAGRSAVAAAELEPAANVTVRVLYDGETVGYATTDGRGIYRLGGLYAEEYTVAPLPTDTRFPTPASRLVELNRANPFGTADFLMSLAPVDSVELELVDTLVALEQRETIKVTARDSLGNALPGRAASFESSDPAVVTVNAKGVVRAVDNGAAWIRVTVESVTDSVMVTVDQRAVRVVLLDPETGEEQPDSLRGFVADTGTVGWYAEDANGFKITHKTPTFLSSDVGLASMSASGFVTLLAPGRVEISAEMDGASDVLIVYVLDSWIGDFVVSGPADLATFAGGSYGKITGSLFVESTALTDLTGLESLLEVGGGVFVRFNANLSDVSALGQMGNVEGDVIFEGNPALATPAGLPAALLEHVGGSVRILDNDALTTLDMFGNLVSVEGDVEVTGNLLLQDLDGLSGLEFIGGSLILRENAALSSLGNLPALMALPGGDLIIEGGGVILGFPALEAVGGALQIGGESGFDLSILQEAYFPALLCVGDLSVYANPNLSTLDLGALDGIESGCGAPAVGPAPQRAEARAARSAKSRLSAQARETLDHIRERWQPDRDADALRRELRRARLALREKRNAGIAAWKAAASQAKETAKSALEAKVASRRTGAARPEGQDGKARTQPGPRRTQAQGPQRVYGGGSFDIYGNPSLSSLNVSSLSYVQYDLSYESGSALTVLAFPALTTVGGSIWFGSIPNLQEARFPSLQTAGSFEIYRNPDLSLIHVPVLDAVGCDIWFEENPSLINMNFPALTRVGCDLTISREPEMASFSVPVLEEIEDGDLILSFNTSLQEFVAAETSVLSIPDGDIAMWQNPSLQTVRIPGLAFVDDDITLRENGDMRLVEVATTTNLSVGDDVVLWGNLSSATWKISMPGLASVDLDIAIWNNSNLASVEMATQSDLDVGFDVDFWDNSSASPWTLAMPGLVTVGSELNIYNNPGLQSFTFPNLGYVANGSWVTDNPELVSFSLPSLVALEMPPAPAANFTITNNAVLTSFDLSSLSAVNQVLVESNPALTSLPGLPSLAANASVLVNGNSSLTDIDGLGGLTQLKEINLNNNPVLGDLSGLSSITTLDDLRIINTGAVSDLSALAALTSSLVTVEILGNPVLADISGLSGIGTVTNGSPAVSNGITIDSGNAALDGCHVQGVLQIMADRNGGDWNVAFPGGWSIPLCGG